MDLRANAARNRTAIVDAARAVFAEQGLDVPLDEIAKRAGTGNATLYRRFPTRGDLIAAVFADRMAEHLDAVTAALADPDPWQAFASYIHAVTAMQARDRGIADLVTMDVSSGTARSNGCAHWRSTGSSSSSSVPGRRGYSGPTSPPKTSCWC